MLIVYSHLVIEHFTKISGTIWCLQATQKNSLVLRTKTSLVQTQFQNIQIISKGQVINNLCLIGAMLLE